MRISSSGTWLYKVVFPAIWLSAFGAGATAVAFGAVTPPPPVGVRIMFPVGWLFGLGIFAWLCFPLKHVSIVSAGIIVEGLRKKITIPLSEIESVSGLSATNPEIITLKLKRESPFGDRIKFTPSTRLWRFFPHPTLTMLSEVLASRPQ